MLKNKKVVSILYICALTFLISSMIFIWQSIPISYQTDSPQNLYLHSEDPLVPVHMHGPPLDPIHMHCLSGLIDLTFPWETFWHVLYPDFCEEWFFNSWEDNGNGYLDTCDQIDMINFDTGEMRWYHVDRVTYTMLVTPEGPGDPMYIEYKGLYEDPVLYQPVCTRWHEVYPLYSNVYHIIAWIDTGGNGVLDFCDWIQFEDGLWWHVEEIATDLILNEKIMDPIGIEWHELYPSFCNWHNLTSWKEDIDDPYPGRLSPNDQIDMFNETSGETKWYHVDRVTFTMLVSNISAPEIIMYIELKNVTFEELYWVKTYPEGTLWHEVYPDYSNKYGIEIWEDNCNGVLSYCDNLTLWDFDTQSYSDWHIEELCLDIILNEKIIDPVCTYWHELYPEFCNRYHIVSWKDNGDELLSPCDYVDLEPIDPSGSIEMYHVENVTLTLNVTILGEPGIYYYFEYMGPFEGMYRVKTDPIHTDWMTVGNEHGMILSLEDWEDNCNGVLSYCDNILLSGTWFHIEEVAIDIVVRELVHDVAVISVTPYFASVFQGWPCPITVTVENQGDFTETFDVDVKYDGNHVTTSPTRVNGLPPKTSRTLTFCWVTKNVPLGPYTISAYAHSVPGETELADNTLTDGTVTILGPQPPGFYWKEGFCDYAPSGMPDFDERQDAWDNPPGSQYWTWCAPTAVANSLWWLDSKFEPTRPPVLPPTISDGFPLVSSYIPGIDDHDPANVQPFIQHLAYLMDTDGQRTGILHPGTYVLDMEAGLAQYLSWTGVNPLGDVNGDGEVNQTDVNIVQNAMGTTPGVMNWDMAADIHPVTLGWPGMGLADNSITAADLALVQANLGKRGLFYEHTVNQPDFYYIEGEVEKSQDVVLSIGFWYFDGLEWIYREELGHCVTVAGVNSEELKIAISDPMWDAFENGLIPEGRVPIPHVHSPPEPPYITHNDAALVSHDIYNVTWITPPFPQCPGGNWTLLNYPGLPGPGWFAVIEDAVITSPLGVHDINVTDVTTSKDGCIPMPTLCQGFTANVTVTILNEGTFTENVTVTAYANTTIIGTQTFNNLAPSTQTTLTFTWTASGFTKGNYTISANATMVPGENDLSDNSFKNGIVAIVHDGDVDGNGKVELTDVLAVALAYGSFPGEPLWNPNLDIDGNGKVDLTDYLATALNYGYVDP